MSTPTTTRKRKTKDETVTDTNTASAAVVPDEPKKTRDTTPVALTTTFAVVGKADVPNRIRMRSRNNPFDEVMGEIWASRLDESGDYVQVGVDNVKRAVRQLVSAAQFHECGVTIHVDTEEETSDRNFTGPGTLWFHARPKRGSDTDESEDAADDSES